MKKRSVIGPRDISVFYTLHLHPALSLKQLAELCFADVSFETARKRLRRLYQSGYMGSQTIEHKEERGRPEHIYFLNANSAKVLAEYKNTTEKSIAFGAPNIRHQDYLLRLAQLHLAWQQTAKKERILSSTFITKRAAQSNENSQFIGIELADATLTFTAKEGQQQSILIVLDTGNLRPTRHWIPKLTALLKTPHPILIVTTDRDRLDTLRKWTMPLIEQFNLPHDRCLFMVHEEIMRYGFLAISAYSTTGSAIKIPA